MLLLFGAELETLDGDGDSALMMAVQFERVEAGRLLLDLNADTTKSNRDGWNVSQTFDNEINQLLLEHSKKSVIV